MKTSDHYNEGKRVSATLIDNLASAMPVGGSLHIRNERFRFDYDGPPLAINNWADFKGCVLMVHVGEASDQNILGSGVLIGPGIALTARHIIAEHEADIAAGRRGLMCSGVANHGVNLWRPTSITTLDHSDVAILTLECCSAAPPDSTFWLATISTRLPPVGERLCLTGYRMYASLSRYNSSGALYLTSGNVVAQYPLGRDIAMLPWPVVEIDTPACRFRRCRHVIPRSCRQAFRYDAATPEGRFSTV
jgi:hypothetical protein